MPRGAYVYLLTNVRRMVIYTGVTIDLERRVAEHKQGASASFTKRHGAHLLVYFAEFGEITEAIAEEKRIKAGSRAAKSALVEAMNPSWRDLSQGW